MKRVVFYIILFICLITNVNAKTTSKNALFVRCVDGDTAVFMVDNEEIKFRFLAIDTPETVHPTVETQIFGKDASELTCNKLTNAKEITLEYESSNKIDKYGRHLAWIWVDGVLLQEELIKVGYGEVAYIYGNYRYTESLCLVQKEAKENNLGIWKDKREEGYCSTVNLDNVENIINYEDIENSENEALDENEELIKDGEKLNSYLDKLSNYIEKNEEKLEQIFTYIFIGVAIIVFIYREFKK